jgi:hypothetical protein
MHVSKAVILLTLVAPACSSSNSNSAVQSQCCVIEPDDAGSATCVCGSSGGPAVGDSITATVTGTSCTVVFTAYYDGGSASETFSGTIPTSAVACGMEAFGL